jgi:predicted metal-dependent hydrolase
MSTASLPRFPPGIAGAVRHFNAGRFFEAHEALEELLDQVEEDRRWELAVALVQVAVAYHKASAGHAGVERMLGLAASKLAALPNVMAGVDVDALRRRVGEDLEILARGGSMSARLADAPPRLVMRGTSGTRHRSA